MVPVVVGFIVGMEIVSNVKVMAQTAAHATPGGVGLENIHTGDQLLTQQLLSAMMTSV
jgi:hypothetical protein